MGRCSALAVVVFLCGACSRPEPPPPVMAKAPLAVPRATASASAAHSARAAPEAAPDPEAQRLFRERLSLSAVPLHEGGAPRVTALALENTARGEAAGMHPEGPVLTANLREGQRAMLAVTLAPRECATFVAEGGLGVVEVDLFLATGSGDELRVLAEDLQGGPIAVVGGRGQCFRNLAFTPLGAELHVTVRRGNGIVLLQRYR